MAVDPNTEIGKMALEGKSIYKLVDRNAEKPEGKIRNIKDAGISYTTGDSSYRVTQGSNQPLAVAAATGKTAYQDSSGEFVNPSVTFSDTGEIKIKAPKSVLETESFQKIFSNNDTLKQLSIAQQSSPDYKFTYYDDDGNKQTTTPTEELKKFDGALKMISDQADYANRVLRPMAASQTDEDTAKKMTMEQLTAAYTPTYNQGDIKVTDTTRISVPKYIESMYATEGFMDLLKKLDSWDEGTRSVERGEFFKELYNRDHFNAEGISQFKAILKSKMENAFIDDGDAVFDGDDLAKTIQLYNFIEHEDPSANWLQVTGDVVTGIGEGVVEGIASAAVDLYDTIEGVANNVVKGAVFFGSYGQINMKVDGGPFTLVKDTREGWEDWKEFRSDQLALVSDTAATTRKIAEVGAHLAADIYVGSKFGKAFSSIAKEAVAGSKVIEGVALGYDTAKVAASAATTADELIVGIRAATKVGDVVKMTEGAIKTQQAIGKFVGTSVDILTQGVVDAAMTDPETMRKLLDGDGDGESYKYLMEQFAWNAGGWAAGIAAAKGIKIVGNTKAGRIANAAWTKTMGKVTAKVGDAVYSLKSKIVGEDLIQHLTNKLAEETAEHGGSATKKASNIGDKLKIQEERQKLRQVKKAFNADIKVSELTGDGLKAAEDYVNQIRTVQNSIDDMHRSLSYRVSTFLNSKINPTIAAADKGIRKSLEKVANIEKLDGLRKSDKFAKEGAVLLTDESTQYLNNVFMAKKMSNAVEAGGELAGSAAEHLDVHVKAIEKFRATHSEELVAALDELLPKYTAFYDAFNEYAVAHGLKNMSMTEGMRQGALFNDEYGYIRVQHDKTSSYAMRRMDGQVKNKTIYDFQHYEFGDPGDYVDLELVRFQHMYDMAATERSQHFVKTLFDSGAAEKQVVMGGDMVEKIRKVSGAKKTFQTTAHETAKYVGDNIDFTSALGKSMDVTEGSTKTAKGWTPRVFKSDRATYIHSLSPTEATQGIKEIGYESGSVFKDIDDAVNMAKSTPTIKSIDTAEKSMETAPRKMPWSIPENTPKNALKDGDEVYFKTNYAGRDSWESGKIKDINGKKMIVDGGYEDLSLDDNLLDGVIKASSTSETLESINKNELYRSRGGKNSWFDMNDTIESPTKNASLTRTAKEDLAERAKKNSKNLDIIDSDNEISFGIYRDIKSGGKSALYEGDPLYDTLYDIAEKQGITPGTDDEFDVIDIDYAALTPAQRADIIEKAKTSKMLDEDITQEYDFMDELEINPNQTSLFTGKASDTRSLSDAKYGDHLIVGSSADELGRSMDSVVENVVDDTTRNIGGQHTIKDIQNNIEHDILSKTIDDATESGIFELRKSGKITDGEYYESIRDIMEKNLQNELNEKELSKLRGETIGSETQVKPTASSITKHEEFIDNSEEVFKEMVDALPDNAKKFLKGKMQTIGGGDDYAAFQKLNKDLGSTFEADFNRVLLSDTPSFRDSDAIKKAVIDQKKAAQAVVDDKLVRTPNTKKFGKEIENSISDSIDDYIEKTSENWSSGSMVEAMTDDAAGLDSDTISKYIALDELKKYKNMNAAYESIDKNIDEMVKGKGMSTDDVDALKEEAHKSFKEKVESEYNSISDTMRDSGSSLYDTEKWYKDVKNAKKDLKDYTEADDVIVVQNEKGEYEYVKTDPVTADLYNYRPQGAGGDEGAIAKANRALSRVFRLGTTTANLKSLANQYFRDTGNALLVGNAWQTVSGAADDMVDVFGERIVKELKEFDPYGMKQVERLAEETGESLEKAAVGRELEMGRALSPASTEVELYNRTRKMMYDKSLRKNRNAADGVKDATNKVIGAIDKPNEIREVYLRNRVFANNFNDALKKGYTVVQAREYAQFAMNNATTNFGRQLYHLRNIANSTPYFSAAINGSTSFWRMFELDPVGITSRIMGGLILPTMYLTGMSLADEKNREVYKNLPEYAKNDNITFVTDGQVYQIPIPQELGSIVAPFRQFVEYLNDSNKNNFWELMLNDALGLSPVDLQGFSTIDMDQMMSDPTIFDRISRGTARIFSQMAPVPVKGAYMLATGTDPYTGKNLRDPSYCYYDAELGQVVTMDYNQSQTSSFLAQMFPNSNAAVMEKVLSGVFGQTGLDVIDSVVGLGQMVAGNEEGKEFFSNLAEKQLTGLSKSFHEDAYNQTNAVWRRSLSTLQTEKEAIQNSDKYKQIDSALSQETDPEKRAKLLAQRRDLTDKFNEKVKNTIDGLRDKYSGTLDRYKFAAVLSLLNFSNGTGYAPKDPVLSEQANQDYYAGRAQAIETLQKMGVKGTDDLSIFGYISKNKITGEVSVKYSTPVQILDAGNKVLNAKKIDAQNIQNLLKDEDLKKKKEAMESQIEVIRGKGKLKSSDYDKMDTIKMEYNNELLTKLAPYVESVSPEAITSNETIMDMLENQLQVPSAYETIKGRHISSENGKLNLQQGFGRSYIKRVFKKLYGKEK